MKEKLLTLAVALLAATGAWAQTTFTADNLTYKVTDAEAKTVTLTRYVTKPTGELTIPATVTYGGTTYSVTAIGYRAFFQCSEITSVTIPDSVTKIDVDAFYSCVGLLQLTIGNGVTDIGRYAFEFCEKLQQVTLGNNVVTIGKETFGYCEQLKQISIPESVMSIEETAFDGCSALTAFDVAEGNTAYCSDGGILFSKDKTTLVKYPEGKPGTSYAIPADVTSISGYAFYGCKTLTAITVPDGVTKIEGWTFAYCWGLTKVTLGSGVTSIGEKAFLYCNSITELTVDATVPPTVEENAFYSVSKNISVYVPKESLAAYKAADGWKEFTNLQAISTTGLQTPAMPESIRIYNGTLHNPQQLHLTLYDMQGRQVYSGTDATVSQPAGVYVVRCNGASGKVLF